MTSVSAGSQGEVSKDSSSLTTATVLLSVSREANLKNDVQFVDRPRQNVYDSACLLSQTECVWQRFLTIPDRMCMTMLIDHQRQNVYDSAHWPSQTECLWQCSLTVRDRTCMTVLVDPPRQNVHERLLAKSGVLGQKVHIQTACCISWHNAFYTRLK